MTENEWAEGFTNADAKEGPEDCEANARLVNCPTTPTVNCPEQSATGHERFIRLPLTERQKVLLAKDVAFWKAYRGACMGDCWGRLTLFSALNLALALLNLRACLDSVT